MKKTRKDFSDAKITDLELREAFNQCDEERKGTIHIKKLKIVMRALGFEPRQAEIDEMIDRMLSNASASSENKDYFSFEELAAIIQQKTNPEADNCLEISSTFKLFDVDGKGYINFKDLKRIAQELGENIDDSEIKEMLNEADNSKKGKVSEKDFKMVMKKTALY